MGDVTMIDTSVFGALNRENSGPIIAKELEDMLANGEKLVVPWSVYREIENTPGAELRAAQLRQIVEYRMAAQRQTADTERLAFYDEFARIEQVKNPGNIVFGLEAKDHPIIADVRIYMRNAGGEKVTFFTVDRMAKNKITIARDYKIEFSPTARPLSGLGRIVPRPPRVLSTKVLPKLKVIGINVALGLGSSLLFGLIGTWLRNWTAEHSIKQDLDGMTSKIHDELPKHKGKIAAIQSRGKQPYVQCHDCNRSGVIGACR